MTTTSPDTAPDTSPDTIPDEERTDLLAALAAARTALINTTRDLTDEQAAQTPTVSTLCLGGLIKHVTAMEERWLAFILEGPSAMSHDLPDGVTWADLEAGTAREVPQWIIDHQNGFRVLPGETLATIIDRYHQTAARTEEIVNTLPDLSTTHPLPKAPWHQPGAVRSARRVLTHVLAETSQHAGHADILRETLDGQTST